MRWTPRRSPSRVHGTWERSRSFILFIGPCSSIFDYTTFLTMLYVFKAWAVDKAALFQTGWFVERSARMGMSSGIPGLRRPKPAS